MCVLQEISVQGIRHYSNIKMSQKRWIHHKNCINVSNYTIMLRKIRHPIDHQKMKSNMKIRKILLVPVQFVRYRTGILVNSSKLIGNVRTYNKVFRPMHSTKSAIISKYRTVPYRTAPYRT